MSLDPQTFDRYDAGLILACCVFLYVNLFAAAGTPFLLSGDQVFMWADAQRLLHGEQIYRDFFQFTAPGADLLYLAAFKLFGARVWTPNLIVLVLGVALCAVCLRISRLIMSRAQAALATSLYVVFVIGGTLDGTHHWFSVLAVLGAVAVLANGRIPERIVVAGALLGVATFITQTRGPAAALAIAAWIVRERSRTQEPWSSCLRQQALLFGSLVVVWGALSAYYMATVGIRELWFFQVTYVRECAVAGWNTWFNGFPADVSRANLLPLVRWLFAFVLLPVVYATCLWKGWRAAPGIAGARFGLLTLVGAALFLEVAQSPSWFRFYCICLPGVILLVWLTVRLGSFAPYATRLLWMGVVGFAAYHTWSMHSHYTAIAQLPAGRVAAPPPAADKLAWLAAHTQPGQFMLQAAWPGIYLPLALRNPIFLDVITPGCSSPTRAGYVALSTRQLEAKRVQYIVWSPRFEAPEVFHQYLLEHYRPIWRFADRDEIWERK